jgi:hypothetical protein
MSKRMIRSAVAAVLLLAVALPAFLGSGAAAQGVPDLYRITGGAFKNHMEYHRIAIPKGGEYALADLKGPGKVTYFSITDDTQDRLYPGLVLKVLWDDEAEPSVRVPLPDFFGAMGGKTIEYQSAPMAINHGCFMCYLPMPFSTRARFVLANDGDAEYSRSVAYGIDYEADPQYASEKSRLHVEWRRSNPVRDGLHTILEASGRGHYVGSFLQVHSRFPGWFGEGDTIFHLDGGTTTHTPGTEDEYGACWGFGHTFSHLACGYIQMEKEDNRMYRWYLANPVRFAKSAKVEIQNQHDNGTPTREDADDYTSVAYWYQEEPHAPIALQPFAQRTAPSRAGVKK